MRFFSFNTLMILIIIVKCMSGFIRPVFHHQTKIVSCQMTEVSQLPEIPLPISKCFSLPQNNKQVPCVCVIPESTVGKSHVITSINHSTLANALVDDPEILLTGIILQEITYCRLTAAAKYFIRRSDNPELPK